MHFMFFIEKSPHPTELAPGLSLSHPFQVTLKLGKSEVALCTNLTWPLPPLPLLRFVCRLGERGLGNDTFEIISVPNQELLPIRGLDET